MWFYNEWIASSFFFFFFYTAFFQYPPKWCTYIAVWLLHGWCHMKLLPSRRRFCVYHTTMHHIISLYAKPHNLRRVHACFAVTCHLLFWQNYRDLLRATAVTRGWNGYRNKEPVQKVDPGEENISRRSCRDSNPRPFDHESSALTTELSPCSLLSFSSRPYVLPCG